MLDALLSPIGLGVLGLVLITAAAAIGYLSMRDQPSPRGVDRVVKTGRRARSGFISVLGHIRRRIVRFFIGEEGLYITRITVSILVVIGGLSGAGLFYALTANVELQGSSAPFLLTFLDIATSGWGYVFAVLWFARGSLFMLRQTMIRRASRITGYSRRSIARLAEEARSTDGCSRIVAVSSDTIDELAQNIRWGLMGKDERIRAATSEVGEAVDVPDWWSEDLSVDWSEADDRRSLSLPERIKLFRMDLAASLNIDDLIWRFAVPAAFAMAAQLILVQFWVWWPLYFAMAGLAMVIGGLVYVVSQWRQSRKLQSLREEVDHERWEEVSVLVKEVETEDITMYYGFLAGRSYASTDPERLSRVLAERAHQRANGKHPAPAIEERWAWCLRRYIPTLKSWEENVEKPRIMDTLANKVADSPDGIISKEQLAYRVVEDGRHYAWRGLRYVGFGNDPRLVQECYEEMVPEGLVEEEITISNPEGEERDVVAVRLRTDPLPPETTELQTTFSSRFRSRGFETRYDLPEVDPDEDAGTFVAPPSASVLPGESAAGR